MPGRRKGAGFIAPPRGNGRRDRRGGRSTRREELKQRLKKSEGRGNEGTGVRFISLFFVLKNKIPTCFFI
jgi:hypothetical protein